MTLPSSRAVTYAYDAAGRLASLTDWQSRTTSFGYDVDSRRTSITRPNGVVSTYGYDAASRTTSIVHALGGTTLQSFSYAYDNADNRTSVTYGGATESYVLDALNRLTNVTYPGGATTAYTYDANGNRATKVTGGVTTTYTYDNGGQLTSDGTNNYTYDAAGNQTARGTDTFSWDYANRMSGATVGGTAATYTYDADGVRTKKVVSGTTTNFVWDRETGLPKLVDDGTKAYLQDDGLIAEIDGSNNASYGLGDAISSVRGLTDGSGTVTGTSDYDIYGGVRASTGTNGSFRFTGEQTDAETGFTFLRARNLDPALGRFGSADTVQPNASGTQGLNLYAYATGNPVRWMDPSGHLELEGKTVPPAVGGLTLLGFLLRATFEALECALDPVCRTVATIIGTAVAHGTATCLVYCNWPGGDNTDPGSNTNPGNSTDPGNPNSNTKPGSSSNPKPDTKPGPEPGGLQPPTRTQTPPPPSPYAVVLQAQGGGVQESVVLGGSQPVTVTEGIAGLQALKLKLSKKELAERAGPFIRADRFIRSGPPLGIGSPGQSFPIAPRNPIRVDVAIFRGINFRQ